MKRNEPVTHVMTKDPVTLHHGDPISKARQLMREHGVHHLPVVSGSDLVGMLSLTDVLRISFGDAFQADERAVDATLDHTVTLEQVMKKDPVSVSKNGSVRDAAELLANGDFHAVPVVEGKQLVGIVTSTDLIRYLLAL
ncbi:MAG: CBS domain-containing protein [Verrucomicrobiaceae bacterium]|nr:CBS domain-containing protein [Verrucomicrobiaceae bacterium]